MIARLLDLLRGKPVVISGTGALPEGQAKKVGIGDALAGTGCDVILCRVGGQLYALDSRCPHEGGRIAEGPLVEGRLATCPLHHYRFDPRDGRCVSAICKNARTYRVREQGGDCRIWL